MKQLHFWAILKPVKYIDTGPYSQIPSELCVFYLKFYFRACSAAREISDFQSNMFVSAGFAIAIAVGF